MQQLGLTTTNTHAQVELILRNRQPVGCLLYRGRLCLEIDHQVAIMSVRRSTARRREAVTSHDSGYQAAFSIRGGNQIPSRMTTSGR